MSYGNFQNLRAEFERLEPWITKFEIEGETFGGHFDALNDARIAQFFEIFPAAENILELGSLEGGHSFALARNNSVRRVLAIEGREKNIEKAKLVQDAFEDKKVEFMKADLEKLDFQPLGQFDAVFCSGLLYHLPRPWELIPKLAKLGPDIFIWTQISDEAKAKKVRSGYRGRFYREGGFLDPLSGLSRKSFWLSLGSLVTLLTESGYREIKIVEHNLAHPNGAAVTLAATQGKFNLVKKSER